MSESPERWLDRIVVVLARPEGAWNVGAVCRAMKTMGLTRLVLVSPARFDLNEVYKSSLHARELYDQAMRFSTLSAALEKVALSAGLTRRRGMRRKWSSMLPEELAVKAASTASGDIALVFGNERAGLDDAELDCCDLACHIPSSPDFPSLNLSHAVQIVASAFWRHSIENRSGTYRPISRSDLEALVAVIHESLDSMAYFKNCERFHTDRFFREILARACLSGREAGYIEKIFRKIQYLKSGENQTPGDSAR